MVTLLAGSVLDWSQARDLQLGAGAQTTSFDSMVAHTRVLFSRKLKVSAFVGRTLDCLRSPS
jgi:hypothetical protein